MVLRHAVDDRLRGIHGDGVDETRTVKGPIQKSVLLDRSRLAIPVSRERPRHFYGIVRRRSEPGVDSNRSQRPVSSVMFRR